MSPTVIPPAVTWTARMAAVLTLSMLGAFSPLHAHARPLLTQPAAERVPAADNAGTGFSNAASDSSIATPASTTWVLIAGLLGGEGGMHRLASRLTAKGYRVVVIDPYAESIDSSNVTFSAMARRLNAELGARNIRQAHVVGHAHGAGIALRLAALYPDRVSALDLLDAGALSSNRTATLGKSLSLVPIVARIPGGRSYIRNKVLDGIRENSANVSWLDANGERSYSDPLVQNIDRSIAILQRLSQSSEPDSVIALVRRVRVPVTVVLGAMPHPSAPPEAQVKALSAVRNCLRVVRLDNVGHFPHEEAPDRLMSVLDSSCHGRDEGVVR